MNLEKRINPDNLIYSFKTDGINSKEFRKDRIKLFKDL